MVAFHGSLSWNSVRRALEHVGIDEEAFLEEL